MDIDDTDNSNMKWESYHRDTRTKASTFYRKMEKNQTLFGYAHSGATYLHCFTCTSDAGECQGGEVLSQMKHHQEITASQLCSRNGYCIAVRSYLLEYSSMLYLLGKLGQRFI